MLALVMLLFLCRNQVYCVPNTNLLHILLKILKID